MDKFIIIDGNSLINRAFYALPPLNMQDGTPTQAVYGFTTMLLKLIDSYKPNYMAVAFDLPQPTFRHKMYEGYKATRKKMPDELAVQLPLLKSLLGKMGIATIELPGYEADDIIGTMAKQADMQTYVVTGDRDSFQLISDDVKVLFTRRGITDMVVMDEAELKTMMGLTPSGVIEYKALAGDSSDNIPGVPGVGDKSALTLIDKYGTIENIYAHIDEMGGKLHDKLLSGKDSAMTSHALATIDTQVPLGVKVTDCPLVMPFSVNVRDEFARLNFRSLVKRDDLFGAQETPRKAIEVREIDDLNELDALASKITSLDLDIGVGVHFAADSNEYFVRFSDDLFGKTEISAVISKLSNALSDETHTIVVFDSKKLMHELVPFGVTLRGYFDVHIAQYLVDMSVPASDVQALLGAHGWDEGAVAVGLAEIANELRKALEDQGMTRLYYDMELPLSAVLFDMEMNGFRIDKSALARLGDRYNIEAEAIRSRIMELAGKPFNVNSPKQLASILFEHLSIPYPKKSKSYSTSAEILEPLAEKYEIVAKVLAYRTLSKMKSVYVDGMGKLLDSRSYAHTDFKQTLTTTGRLSSAEPNLQNIPVREAVGRLLREVFVASEGCTLVSADYSQIELRLMAHFSGDQTMLSAYRQGEDIHAATAAQVFGVPVEQVDQSMRSSAKAVNFGIIYGMGDYGLASSLRIPVYKAHEYIVNYFTRFGGVKKYLDEAVERARQCGYAVSLLGRRRNIPELRSSNHNLRAFGERVAMNMPLQGSAADIIKLAMLEVHRRLQGMKSKLIMQVHDELIIDAANDEVDAVLELLSDCMENAVKLDVPLIVNIACGKNWMECK